MLTYIRDTKSIPFFEISQVYQQSIETPEKQRQRLWMEEQALYDELQDLIERRKGALAIWRAEQEIQSVLRLEKYLEGYLIQSLQTQSQSRRKGFALKLMTAVLDDHPKGTVFYSHVKKDNLASMQLHLRCGFQVHSDIARLLDGTVTNRYVTFKLLKD